MAVGRAREVRQKWVLAAGIFMLLIFAGCVKKDAVKNQVSEEGLRERVMAYCEHLVKQEFDKAYLMEYPLYRKNVSVVEYIRRHSNPMMQYDGCEVSGLREGESETTVDLKVKVNVKVPGAKVFQYEKAMSEKWVRVEGAWYHVADKNSAPTRDSK